MKRLASPNYNTRATNLALEYIVLHYTGMRTAAEALARLCDPAAQVSAHYVIDEDGVVTQLVDEKQRAWHAGKSLWKNCADINSASIGIELVNPGHEHGYRAFPDTQIDSLLNLLPRIIARHGLDARRCLLAHSDVAPARKEDPGELFPWQRLTQQGFGVWPSCDAADFAAANEAEAATLLRGIGYDVGDVGKAVLAFQRRYYPEMLTGVADAPTVGRLRAVHRVLDNQTRPPFQEKPSR